MQAESIGHANARLQRDRSSHVVVYHWTVLVVHYQECGCSRGWRKDCEEKLWIGPEPCEWSSYWCAGPRLMMTR